MSCVYPARPVEPGTLWVFNRGEIYPCNSEAHFTGELSAILFVPFIFADGVLKKGASSSKKW